MRTYYWICAQCHQGGAVEPDGPYARDLARAVVQTHNREQQQHGCVPHLDKLLVSETPPPQEPEVLASAGDLLRVAQLLHDPFPSGAGATGQFPAGKLTADDEGEIRVAVANRNGKVVIDFGKPVAWLAMGPSEADAFVDVLRQHADTARASE